MGATFALARSIVNGVAGKILISSLADTLIAIGIGAVLGGLYRAIAQRAASKREVTG